MTITHGILFSSGPFDFLIHEIKTMGNSEAKKISRKINWNKTKSTNHLNRGLRTSIYREDWR